MRVYLFCMILSLIKIIFWKKWANVIQHFSNITYYWLQILSYLEKEEKEQKIKGPSCNIGFYRDCAHIFPLINHFYYDFWGGAHTSSISKRLWPVQRSQIQRSKIHHTDQIARRVARDSPPDVTGTATDVNTCAPPSPSINSWVRWSHNQRSWFDRMEAQWAPRRGRGSYANVGLNPDGSIPE